MAARGIKIQVFGGALFCLGAVTALLSRAIGFELDIFYVIIGIAGICLFVYGSTQRSRAGLTGGKTPEPASMKRRISVRGE